MMIPAAFSMDSFAAHEAAKRRTVVRRAVSLSCGVRSELWDGLAPFLATDLSEHGLRLCSPFALPEGQDVVVTFTPPRWPDFAGPINALARVAHVELPRRRADVLHGAPAGMGLSFMHVDPASKALLALTLRGLPPPLPQRNLERGSAPLIVSTRVAREELLEHDGLDLVFCAEAPLLTASRPVIPVESTRTVPGTRVATSSTELRRRFRSYRYRSQRDRGAHAPSRGLELVS